MKALVVHGKPVEALELCQTLTEAGAQVQYAPSAKYALELLEREQPDVIICEQGLSDMGGHELLGILRVEDLYESIPFILLSSSAPEIAEYHAVLPRSTSVATVAYFAHEMTGEAQPTPVPQRKTHESAKAVAITKLTDLQPGETIEISAEELARIIEGVIA
jgi:CheY-like chemotaxis protein